MSSLIILIVMYKISNYFDLAPTFTYNFHFFCIWIHEETFRQRQVIHKPRQKRKKIFIFILYIKFNDFDFDLIVDDGFAVKNEANQLDKNPADFKMIFKSLEK